MFEKRKWLIFNRDLTSCVDTGISVVTRTRDYHRPGEFNKRLPLSLSRRYLMENVSPSAFRVANSKYLFLAAR